MGFDDWPVHPTQYFLGDVALWYCNVSIPLLRRGVKPAPVTFFQPSEMYWELKPLESGDPVELKVVEASRDGSRRETVFGGMLVTSVVMIEDGSISGCRITLSDIREYIDRPGPWPFDINLVEDHALVPGTIAATGPHTLKTFWQQVLEKEYPFAGRMDDGYAEDIPATSTISYDTYKSGGLRSDVLQQLLEAWQCDLVLSTTGRFYVADRFVEPGATDLGVAQLYEGDFEWAEKVPVFNLPANAHLKAKKYVVPFWERHNVQVWYNPYNIPRPSADTASFKAALPAGLELIQVYEALEDYWDFQGLLRVFGYAQDDLFFDLAAEEFARRRFTRTFLRGSVFDRNRNLSDLEPGSQEYLDEEAKVLSAIKAVKAGERRLYKIGESQGSSVTKGVGHWQEIELGRQRPDGTVVAQRAIGDYALVYEKVKVTYEDKNKNFPRVPIAENLDFGRQLRDTRIYRPAPASEFERLYPEATASERVERWREFIADQQRWPVAKAAPMTPKWDSKPSRVVRLHQDDVNVGELGKVYMGTIEEIPEMDLSDIGRGRDSKKKEVYDGMKLSELGSSIDLRDDLYWTGADEYSFWIMAFARRNWPQTMEKFWLEEVDGFDDAEQDEIVLLPDDRVEMRRDYADVLGIDRFHQPEADGLGPPMNLVEVQAQARRRAGAVKAHAAHPEPVQHRFFNIHMVKSLRLRGSLDQVVLHINGPQVECELFTGARTDDHARRMEAELQRNRSQTEFAGKVVKR